MPKIPPLYLFGASRASTSLSFSLEFTCTAARNSQNREMGGNLVKSWVIPLSWYFLVSTLTHPSKELHISTLFRAPVNVVGDKFGSAPVGLWFRRKGALERRNDTKS